MLHSYSWNTLLICCFSRLEINYKDAKPIQSLSYKYIYLKYYSSRWDRLDPANEFIRRLSHLCYIVHKQEEVSSKLILLACQIGGRQDVILQERLRLCRTSPEGKLVGSTTLPTTRHNNLDQVPHILVFLLYFFNKASKAVLDSVIACSNGDISNRMKMMVMFPETNPQEDLQRDSYR